MDTNLRKNSTPILSPNLIKAQVTKFCDPVIDICIK